MAKRKLGNIVETRPGVFKIRVSAGKDSAGRRRVHSETVEGSAKDAEKAVARLVHEYAEGQRMKGSRERLDVFIENWLRDVVALQVRPRTLKDYGEALRRYVFPDLGSQRLDKLNAVQMQGVISKLSNQGLAPRTIRYPFSRLIAALNYAVEVGYLRTNPAKALKLPKLKGQEMRSLTPDQLRNFLAEAKGTRFEALWLLLAGTGLRPGEALGLKWGDLQDGTLFVQRSLALVAGEWIFGDPKTPKSQRKIPLPNTVWQALEEHRERQGELRRRWIKSGREWADQDLVFCAQAGQPLDWRLVARRYFKPIAKRCGLRHIRPYDLRHTFASFLLAEGNSIKVVSEMLGHANATMTLDVYGHVLPGMQEKAAASMDRILRDEVNAK
jgi:integrase